MAEDEKTFYIRSQLNGLVLDIRGAKTKPGTSVITWHVKDEEATNQVWYEDEATGTIRSKLHDLCLDLGADEDLVVNHYIPGGLNQQWVKEKHRIHDRNDDKRVLEVEGANSSPGATIRAAKWNGGDNQRWDFPKKHQGAMSGWRAKKSSKPFYIRSAMHGKVLDVHEASLEPGADVIVWSKKPQQEDSQLWYTDERGIIRSKLNEFALTASKGGFHLHPYEEENEDQQWTFEGNKIFNRNNTKRCVDIKGEDSADGATVIPYKYGGNANQMWHFDIV